MPLVILATSDKKAITGARGAMRRVNRKAMKSTAEYWHKNLFPRHFEYGNRGAYDLAPRKAFYTDFLKKFKGTGAGVYVDLILSGKSARAMRHNVTITGGPTYAQITMKPPAYFTNPTGNNQPDKAAEVVQFSSQDKADLMTFFNSRVALLSKEFE